MLDRVDSLIDDLLNDGNLSSSSLASILMAAANRCAMVITSPWRGGPGTRVTTSSSGSVREVRICSTRRWSD